jgi:hypothetical protein
MPLIHAAALKGNEELRSLELSYNPIGAQGTKAFADIVKYDMKVRGQLAGGKPLSSTVSAPLEDVA